MILKSRGKQVRILKIQGEQRCPAGLRSLWQNPEQRGETARLVLIPGVHSPGQRLWGLPLGRLDLGLAPSSPWSPQDTHPHMSSGASRCPSPGSPSLGSTLHGGLWGSTGHKPITLRTTDASLSVSLLTIQPVPSRSHLLH